jgi:hypothetical protein
MQVRALSPVVFNLGYAKTSYGVCKIERNRDKHWLLGPDVINLFILYVGSSMWSSGQSFWLQIQMSGFDSRCYLIFWEVVSLERSQSSLLSTLEGLLEWKCSDSGLESRKYGRRDPSRWPCGTLYPQKLALTLSTSGDRSVGIVRSRNQATELKQIYS